MTRRSMTLPGRLLALLLLTGCPQPFGDPCAGDGPAALEIGRSGPDGFLPFEDGDGAPIEALDGEYGFDFLLRTEGLDVREPVVFVAEVSAAEAEPRSLFLQASLVCQPDETGAMSVWIPLANIDQSHAGALALDGELLVFEVTIEDAAEDAATTEVRLPIDASGLEGRRRP